MNSEKKLHNIFNSQGIKKKKQQKNSTHIIKKLKANYFKKMEHNNQNKALKFLLCQT